MSLDDLFDDASEEEESSEDSSEDEKIGRHYILKWKPNIKK